MEVVCKQLNLPAFILCAKLHKSPHYRLWFRACVAESAQLIASPSVILKYFIYEKCSAVLILHKC